jgi:hypothetical protein
LGFCPLIRAKNALRYDYASHEAIISRDVWDRVQSYVHKKYNPKRRKDGGTNLFAGFVFCADCGFKLRGCVERRTRKDGSEYRYASYMCGTYGNNGKSACTAHIIGENVLIELISEIVNKIANSAKLDEQHILSRISSAKDTSYQCAYESELEIHRRQIEKLDSLIENLYADKVTGVVPESFFKRQIAKYEQERAELNKSIKLLEKRIRFITPSASGDETLDLIKQHSEIKILDTETLLLLINRIVVGEPQLINENRVCDIQVFI